MTETLFDKSDEYDQMLNQGLKLSGEDRHYFLAGRVRDLKERLRGASVHRILDFGCGLGDTSIFLAEEFPTASVLGCDTATRAIEHARAVHGSPRVSFCDLSDLEGHAWFGSFDLCYANGVFHHVPLAERSGAMRLVRGALRSGGKFALFENNPWNPGTRMVMSRVPFDRDAVTLSHLEANRLLREGGFSLTQSARFLFYFPRFLAGLRFTEGWLTGVPLGAQYYHLAQRD